MKLIGLTGGIGMGKSTAARLFAEAGLPVIDTDELARDVVAPGESALAEIQEAFGAEMIDAQGQLRREELARCVFQDAARRHQLEAILHPRIRKRWKSAAASWRQAGQPLGLVVIPLLFETRAEAEFDWMLCVACSPATQQARLASRGWTPEQIAERIAAQWPMDQKMARCHFVLWNESSLGVLAAQIQRVLGQMRNAA